MTPKTMTFHKKVKILNLVQNTHTQVLALLNLLFENILSANWRGNQFVTGLIVRVLTHIYSKNTIQKQKLFKIFQISRYYNVFYFVDFIISQNFVRIQKTYFFFFLKSGLWRQTENLKKARFLTWTSKSKSIHILINIKKYSCFHFCFTPVSNGNFPRLTEQ